MMKCPDCKKEMEQCGLIVMTAPPIYHECCDVCNSKWDIVGGKIKKECFQSPRKRKEGDPK